MYYYQLFETNRSALANLYQESSMLTFEGQKFMGTQQVVSKLTSLPFNNCKVTPTSMDFQPSVSGGILVFVTGQVLVGSLIHLLPVGLRVLKLQLIWNVHAGGRRIKPFEV